MFNTQPGAAHADRCRPNGIKLTIVSERCLKATILKIPPLFCGNKQLLCFLFSCRGAPLEYLQWTTQNNTATWNRCVCACVHSRLCVRACMRVFVKPNESNIRLDKKCRALGYICCGNIVAFGKAHIKMMIQIPSLIHRHTHTHTHATRVHNIHIREDALSKSYDRRGH